MDTIKSGMLIEKMHWNLTKLYSIQFKRSRRKRYSSQTDLWGDGRRKNSKQQFEEVDLSDLIGLSTLPASLKWGGGGGGLGGLRVSNKLDSTTWPVQGEPWVSEPDKHTLLGYSVVSLQPHTAAKSRSNNLHSPPVARVKPRPPWKWHKTGILPFYQQLWGTSACWSLGSACAHLFLSWLSSSCLVGNIPLSFCVSWRCLCAMTVFCIPPILYMSVLSQS